jgi:cytochrome c
MFDTMKMTKAVAAGCGALLVFLLAGWAGTSLYTVGHGGEHGAKEGEEAAASPFVIAVEEAAPAGGTAEAGPDFATLYADADATKGEAVFRKCSGCHKVDGSNGVGPHLNGVVGRNHAAVEGFAYSDANKAMAAEPWTPEALFSFVEAPRKYMPGTKMSFNGLPNAEDRANLIAYLATTK